MHIAAPCASFSVALNGSWSTRVRSREHPAGLSGLSPQQAHMVRLGNALAEAAATLMKVQWEAANHYQLEQPARSIMPYYAPMAEALSITGGEGYQRDACADGAPWRKPLVLYTATWVVGPQLATQCPGCPNHIQLRGRAPNGVDWTKIACPYWPAWAMAVAKCWWRAVRYHRRKTPREEPPMMVVADGACHSEALAASNFRPSGGRSLEKRKLWTSFPQVGNQRERRCHSSSLMAFHRSCTYKRHLGLNIPLLIRPGQQPRSNTR